MTATWACVGSEPPFGATITNRAAINPATPRSNCDVDSLTTADARFNDADIDEKRDRAAESVEKNRSRLHEVVALHGRRESKNVRLERMTPARIIVDNIVWLSCGSVLSSS